jgi:uncharacterized membrane protein
MLSPRRLAGLLGLLALSCGGGGGTTSSSTPTTSSTTTLVNGCPSLEQPVARTGDAIDGDTYQTFARPFFSTWCVRCHSVTLTTPAARSGAPEGFNWDVESAVRANLSRIRTQVGVLNLMPLTPPRPSCDERRRLVRWIDAGAP